MGIMNNPLIKIEITLVFVVLILAILAISLTNYFRNRFQGGTLYQIELQKDLSNEEIGRMANIIAQRIDPAGLKDASVYPVGTRFIVIQLAETDLVELEKIESRIRQQGKFESALNGETIFTGDEIRKVLRGDNSYGVMSLGKNYYEWSLPFILNEAATKRFSEKTFHQCSATGFNSKGVVTYDCEKTVFFLDKPEAIIVTTQDTMDYDETIFYSGNMLESIPAGTDVDELIEDSQLDVFIIEDSIDLDKARESFKKFKSAIVSNDVSEEVINDLNAIGFEVIKQGSREGVPWIWSAMNAKQIISLTEGITNEDVSDVSQAQLFLPKNIWV